MKKQPGHSTLMMDVCAGDRVSLSASEEISIELVEKSGRKARLKITAPRDVKISREPSSALCESVTSIV